MVAASAATEASGRSYDTLAGRRFRQQQWRRCDVAVGGVRRVTVPLPEKKCRYAQVESAGRYEGVKILRAQRAPEHKMRYFRARGAPAARPQI